MIWAAGLVGAVLAGSSGASIALTYEAPPACPPVEHFHRQLAARLGYDPVREPSTQHVKVFTEARDGALVVSLRVDDAKERLFPGGPTDCESLVDGAAIALAIALDPVTMVRARKPAAPPAPQQAVVAEPAPATPAVEAVVLAGIRSSIALLPQLALGPVAQARVRIRRFSITLEGDAAFALPLRVDGGMLGSSAFRGGAQLCAHAWFAGLCVRGTGGAVAISGTGFTNAHTAWLPLATLGPAFTADWSPTPGLLLQAAAGVELSLFRHAVAVGAADIWQASLFTGFLTLGAGWHFL
ncbi:MAG: hypothetical protein IPJ65_07985 [Archangiaceae bacterium]|nr:hypothetical protein [Archangiaceae bacterium]